MQRRIRNALNLFRLTRYEGQSPLKLYIIYALSLLVASEIAMRIAEANALPQLAQIIPIILFALMAYGLFISIVNTYCFLAHVESVIKALLCTMALLLLRHLALKAYGKINAYEIWLTILFSFFGRAALVSSLKSLKIYAEIFQKPKIHPDLLKNAEYLSKNHSPKES